MKISGNSENMQCRCADGAVSEEQYNAALRSLYGRFGYQPYKMSKFEEYDLYAGNKDFLISDGIITFTDTDGRLMALKPDVTLSIIKNTDIVPGGTVKVFYSENVYRVPKGSETFREIVQTGLECIGRTDPYCIAEVIYLAAESLRAAGKEYVLDIGQLELLDAAASKISTDPAVKNALMKCAAEKNRHGVDEITARNANAGAGAGAADVFKMLIGLYGRVDEALPQVRAAARELGMQDSYDSLKEITDLLRASDGFDRFRIDFSAAAAGGGNYYNGIGFKGYVEGIPERVLSGGQYDRLVRRFHPDGEAIGFAVYLDTIEKYTAPDAGFDGDLLLLYPETAPRDKVLEAVLKYTSKGMTVRAARAGAEDGLSGRFRRVAFIDPEGAVKDEL